MTPVDIDKLKELLSKVTPGDWATQSDMPWIVSPAICECFGMTVSVHNAALIAAAKNALPTLIAKAERVDALTEALRPFAQVAEGEVYKLFAQEARLTFTLCRPDGKRFCFINAECFDAARNALSPKESK